MTRRPSRRAVALSGALIGFLPLAIPSAANAATLSWSGKPGSNTVCDINATVNYAANGGGGTAVTSVGPIAAVSDGCSRVRVTVDYYYAGSPRSVSKTVDPRTLTNDPNQVIAKVSFPGSYIGSSHCGKQFDHDTFACHKLGG